MLFRFVEERILCIYKSLKKLTSNIISIWLNSIPVLINALVGAN